jgi:hypothetical protein
MTVNSKAIIRDKTLGPQGEYTGETRIFKRPKGDGFTRATYPNDDTPDDQPAEAPEVIAGPQADLHIKLLTGKDVNDYLD